MRNAGRWAAAILCCALAGAGGCGREEPARTGPGQRTGGPGGAAERAPVGAGGPDAGAAAVSGSGEFRVVWPSGCDYLVTRSTDSATGKGRLISVTCDREERKNEGAAVRIHLGLAEDDGSAPTPRTVIEMVKKEIQAFGVKLISQRPVRRGPLEGVQALCEEPGSTGQVWIEGLLLGSNVYFLIAWKGGGGLFDDSEYSRFFASFDPNPQGPDQTGRTWSASHPDSGSGRGGSR